MWGQFRVRFTKVTGSTVGAETNRKVGCPAEPMSLVKAAVFLLGMLRCPRLWGVCGRGHCQDQIWVRKAHPGYRVETGAVGATEV